MDAAQFLGPMLSYHFDRAEPYSEVHPGLGYRSEQDYVVGVYLNSYRRPSVYAGRRFGGSHIGLTLGLVSGYPQMRVAPFALPEVSFELGGSTWALMLQPPVGHVTKGALLLQWRKNKE